MIKRIEIIKCQILNVLMNEWGGETWLGYDVLANDTGSTVEECKRAMKELREVGYVTHEVCVDHDGKPCGSGYFLTPKFFTTFSEKNNKKS